MPPVCKDNVHDGDHRCLGTMRLRTQGPPRVPRLPVAPPFVPSTDFDVDGVRLGSLDEGTPQGVPEGSSNRRCPEIVETVVTLGVNPLICHFVSSYCL